MPATLATNLPVALAPFVGREQELASLEEALSRTRLLTLTGAGGCGKTRLALQLASTVAHKFHDSACWVDLSGVADPELVPQSIAAVLGVHETAEQPIIESLTGFLRSRELLLVLDNCEHLLSGCALLAETLLTTCPGIQILATSRESLNLAGETIWRVPPLSLPTFDDLPNGHLPNRTDSPIHLPPLSEFLQYDAIRLFTQRSSSVQRAFALTDENAWVVFQICRRLDGLPLAIELAAARVKVLSVEQILERLDDCFSAGLFAGRPSSAGVHFARRDPPKNAGPPAESSYTL